MSTVQAYFPGRFYTSHRTFDPRSIAILCLAVAIGCAAIVFVILYNLDQDYPVTAVPVHAHSATLPPVAAMTRRTPSRPLVSTASTFTAKNAAVWSEPIARTHDELLALEQLGKRNYVEFSVARSAGFEPVGPIKIACWRTDSKHGSVQISVLQNTHRRDFKRLKVDERISIPIAHSQTLQLVINGASKKQITGYLSEPKTPASK